MGEKNMQIEILQIKGIQCKIEYYKKWNWSQIDNLVQDIETAII